MTMRRLRTMLFAPGISKVSVYRYLGATHASLATQHASSFW